MRGMCNEKVCVLGIAMCTKQMKECDITVYWIVLMVALNLTATENSVFSLHCRKGSSSIRRSSIRRNSFRRKFNLAHVHSGAVHSSACPFRRMFISALQFKPAHWFKPQPTRNFHFYKQNWSITWFISLFFYMTLIQLDINICTDEYINRKLKYTAFTIKI